MTTPALDSAGQPLEVGRIYKKGLFKDIPVRVVAAEADLDGNVICWADGRYWHVRPDFLNPLPPEPTFIDLWESNYCDGELWHQIREEQPQELRLGGGHDLVYRRVES